MSARWTDAGIGRIGGLRRSNCLIAIGFLASFGPLVVGWLGAGAAEQAGTPASVLDGTDLVDLNQFSPMDLPQPIEGTYRAEQGGAVLSLHITAAGDRWTLKRTYEEPDLGVETKVYSVERRGQALVSVDNSLEARGSEDGMLVFEASSGSDSIPPDYWIRYFRAQ